MICIHAVMSETRATLCICLHIFITTVFGLYIGTKNGVTKADIFYGTPGKYLPNALLESREEPKGISRIECAAECKANPECKSFNVRSGNTVCELNSAVDFTPNKVGLVDDAASRHYVKVPHDCADYVGLDGVHCINVNSMNRQLRVSCEEGWTVLMRRTGPELNFNRSWADYRDGFGDVAGDHWLGLEAFHHLTYQGNYSLMVEVRSLPTDNYYWEIHHGFRIGPESGKYVFNEFQQGFGNISQGPNYWSFQFGMPFSTYDADNDENIMHRNCADEFKGGWWYSDCTHISLTGKMATMNCTAHCYLHFKHAGVDDGDNEHLLRSATMKIKKFD